MNKPIQISQSGIAEILKQESTSIVDIRDPWEFSDFNIGGMNVPAHGLNEHKEQIQSYKNIIVVCSNGTRSSIVARVLGKKLPNTTIYHLEEGIF
jgi:rhodanese-related sulfurtransferase